jgi:hypothetical protein
MCHQDFLIQEESGPRVYLQRVKTCLDLGELTPLLATDYRSEQPEITFQPGKGWRPIIYELVLGVLRKHSGDFKEVSTSLVSAFLPLPRLVGIELNPGPPKRKASTALVPYKPPKKQKKNSTPTPMGIKNATQTRFIQAGAPGNEKSEMYKYACCLRDPFDCIPVRLGGDCMMPTGTATLTSRSIISPGTGTSFSMVLYPWAQLNGFISVSAASPYSYPGGTTLGLPGGFPQGPALANVANGARVVAAGVRIATLASATNDSGVITIGCLPRETLNISNVTGGGFPSGPTLAATQGFNEFLNYLQTESYPLKMGASAFFRPQDPLDYTFRNTPLVTGAGTANPPADQGSPFFVIGVSGAVPSQSYLVEQIVHLEYSVADSVTGVINTGMGTMGVQSIINSGKSVFSSLVDTTIAGVVGGLPAAGARAGQLLLEYLPGSMRSKTGPLASGSQFSSSTL